MSKPETVDIAAKALLHEISNDNFAEILRIWLSLVYDTAYLAGLREQKQPQLPDVPFAPKKLPTQFFATQNAGCYLCGAGAGGKVAGYVCVQTNCPTRVSC